MNKKILIGVSTVVFLALVGGGYYYWKTQMQKSPAEQTTENIQETPAGVLPTIDTGAVNPMESAQSANPYDKTNPFSNIKINPFK